MRRTTSMGRTISLRRAPRCVHCLFRHLCLLRGCSVILLFRYQKIEKTFITFYLVIYPAAHHTKLQFIRIFIIHHTAVILHPVTFIFHIWQEFFRHVRIKTLHILKISALNFLIIIGKGHRVHHVIRQFWIHNSHFHFKTLYD